MNIVDHTFFKSKYKGALLISKDVDDNSNMYLIVFGLFICRMTIHESGSSCS